MYAPGWAVIASRLQYTHGQVHRDCGSRIILSRVRNRSGIDLPSARVIISIRALVRVLCCFIGADAGAGGACFFENFSKLPHNNEEYTVKTPDLHVLLFTTYFIFVQSQTMTC